MRMSGWLCARRRAHRRGWVFILLAALVPWAGAQQPLPTPYRGTYIPQYAFPIAAAPPLAPESDPVRLDVDATEAWRGVLSVREVMPVKPGPLTLVYPKWVPGEHGPTGPIDELAELRFTAGGHPLAWRRDPVRMYAFHLDIPAGARILTATFTVLMNDASGTMATRAVAVLNWNRALLYQDGVDSHTFFFRPSITLPPDWQFGTALTQEGQQKDGHVAFATLSLAMLVDSPLDMGRYVQKWTLGQMDSAKVELDAFADHPEDLKIPASLLAAYERVPQQALAAYGSRHFASYHALLTLSDPIGFQGIEHHQSSDDRAPDDFLLNPAESMTEGDLVTHELSHSWNGKYRRPADLATPNFQVPMRTDLLWVYEGLNQYVGDMLSFRAGIREPLAYPEFVAAVYAELAVEPGRQSTPIIALTTAAPYLYQATNAYPGVSRTEGDFYMESELVWLDADTIIRSLSGGARSLDDFLHLYTAPALTPPITKTYTREQIEALLNQVQPYDWHGFFQKHIYDIAPLPPTDELARAGWKLVYTSAPNPYLAAGEVRTHGDSIRLFDLGLIATATGSVKRLVKGSPAWKAGLAEGDQIVAVDHRSFTPSSLTQAIEEAQHATSPMVLQVSSTGVFKTLDVDYHGGLRNPHLERIPTTPDMLAAIMARR